MVEPASGSDCVLKVEQEWSYRAAVGMFPLSPPQDQECAGALMWVWVTYAYLIPAVVITVQLLSFPNQQPLNTTQTTSSAAIYLAGMVGKGFRREKG